MGSNQAHTPSCHQPGREAVIRRRSSAVSRRVGGLVLTLVSLAAMPAAFAAEDSRAAAKSYYEKGMAHYQLEEWDQAIENFQAGFRAKPAPQFLYNIAQAYRLSKRPEKALHFYQKYLNLEPMATNRHEVEAQIKTLEELVSRQQSSAKQPPQQTIPPNKEGEARPDLVSAPGTATKDTRPTYKKGWFWGVIAGSVAVAATAVTLGVVLGTRSSAETLPAARF